MRITSGSAKGFTIKIPKGNLVKPAQDIVRQAIFNMIGEHVVGANVLDLFAGSGSLGLEALSRGAGWVGFVDQDKRCTQVIKENLVHTRFEDKAKVYTMKSKRFLNSVIRSLAPKPVGFIFLSPPYEQGIDVELLEKMTQVLKNKGLIIFEHSQKTKLPKLPSTLTLLDQRTYGAATVSLIKKRT